MPEIATPQTAPAGTRVWWRGADGPVFATVTGWINQDVIGVRYDSGGTYAGPTWRSAFVGDRCWWSDEAGDSSTRCTAPATHQVKVTDTAVGGDWTYGVCEAHVTALVEDVRENSPLEVAAIEGAA